MPTGPFGIDLQVDVGNADGRCLMLSLSTGTNEGWISTQRYLAGCRNDAPAKARA